MACTRPASDCRCGTSGPNGEAIAVQHQYLRLTACPALSAKGMDDVGRQLSAFGTIAAALSDADLMVSCLTVDLDAPKWSDALGAAARSLAAFAPGRLLRIEALTSETAALPDEGQANALGTALKNVLRVPVITCVRSTRGAQWATIRPFTWGRRGIAANQPGSQAIAGSADPPGAALVIGAPTLIYKIRLEDVSDEGAVRACRAVGGPHGGFADVGAYPTMSAVDGNPIVVLELEEDSRAPLHRVLDVLEVECARDGGRLGRAALLSHISLETLLATLRARATLAITPAQIIETHLPVGGGDAAAAEPRP